MLAPLVERKCEVLALERYVTGRHVLGGERKINSVFCDLRDHFAVRRIAKEHQPEVVIHLASISPVSYSYDHPNEVLDANLTGTVKLAEACLREIPHFRQFLFASTSETYGNGPVPKREDTPQNPNSPYSVSKLAAEKYLLFMRDAYGFPVTVLRPFNTYGRKDDTQFVVERLAVQMLQGGPVRLGDPTPLRDLIYIDDHVNAYMTCLGKKNAIGGVYNFCSGRSVSIRELATMLVELTGFEGELAWGDIPARPLDIREMYGDYSKAERELGWRPQVCLKEGLRLTVEYWRKCIARKVGEGALPRS